MEDGNLKIEEEPEIMVSNVLFVTSCIMIDECYSKYGFRLWYKQKNERAERRLLITVL